MADCLLMEGRKMIIHILAGGPEYCADFARYEDEEVVWAAVDREYTVY